MTGRFACRIAATARSSGPVSGSGRRMCHSRGCRNATGTSSCSACTSSGRAIVTAPVSAGSVRTRIAWSAIEKSCSGRTTRSKKRESGRNASVTWIEVSCGISICCSTGSVVRVAKVSDGSSSAGSRFVVASAAAVSMLAAPGPTEAVAAKVARRRCIRANPTASCTIACSLRAWWYGSSPGCSTWSCLIACPSPATLPCPKMPKMPGIVRSRTSPSTVHWLARNSTSAWPTVMRRVVGVVTRPP